MKIIKGQTASGKTTKLLQEIKSLIESGTPAGSIILCTESNFKKQKLQDLGISDIKIISHDDFLNPKFIMLQNKRMFFIDNIDVLLKRIIGTNNHINCITYSEE